MEAMLPYVLGFLGVVIGAMSTYFIAKRNTSGRVDTTDAATLWAQRTLMSNEMRDEIVSLRAIIQASANATSSAVIAAAVAAEKAAGEITNLRSDIAKLNDELTKLRAQIGNGGIQ